MLARAALVLLLSCAGVRIAAAAAPELFRPLLADPRESVIHLGVSSFRQDFRYGTDVTDSTSIAGWIHDVHGVGFDVGGGKVFHLPACERMFGWRGPWRAYQLQASALTSSSFDRIQSQFVTVADYQFGGAIAIQWTGAGDAERGATRFDAPVLTSRTAILHRSSHLGDEYLGQANFGRNQTGPGAGVGLFAHPPIKRTVISYEVVEHVFSLEAAPGPGHRASVRLYAGGEWKAEISRRKPRGLDSAVGHAGFEWRSLGNVADPPPSPLTAWIDRLFGGNKLHSGWIAAVDLRLARPFDFAGCDNPDGAGEVWTPSLWTPCECGHELRRYAGTWQGLAGVTLFAPRARAAGAGGVLTAGETVLALEWSQGYSWRGPFLDSRRAAHPRWGVVPTLITHF